MLIAFLTFPSPWKHLVQKVLLWNSIFIKGDLPMDQYLSDILFTIFMHFSLTSGPIHMKVSSSQISKLCSNSWAFNGSSIFNVLLVLWILECSCILKTSFDSRTIKIVGACILDSWITDTWIANSWIIDSSMEASIGASRIGFWKIIIIFFVGSLD